MAYRIDGRNYERRDVNVTVNHFPTYFLIAAIVFWIKVIAYPSSGSMAQIMQPTGTMFWIMLLTFPAICVIFWLGLSVEVCYTDEHVPEAGVSCACGTNES